MKSIRYCTQCVMPDTKPDLELDENGVCSACRHYERREDVDWNARAKELERILVKYRSNDGSNYDCVVPISGGKDSTYQVLKMLEYGMNPLCVSGITDMPSEIGRKNLNNLKRLGVDCIDVTVNPEIRRRINKYALINVGDIIWPEHAVIFTIPVRIAIKFGVKLIIWGENSQNEYGGPAAGADNNTLTKRWLEEFGGLLGMRPLDLIGKEGIERKHLIQYLYPPEDELEQSEVTGLFLGYYLPWDGLTNALISTAYGLTTYPQVPEGCMANYENLDNLMQGIHDYFKFLKYGFARTADQVCLHIRRGRLTRKEGLAITTRNDGKFPWTCLGVPLEEILDYIDMDLDEFVQICDKWTNKNLFLCDSNGNLVKDRKLNLTKVNYDNA